MPDESKTVATTLRAALSETWAFYFQSQSFHWNVTGDDFPQLHEFFGSLYRDANGAVDGLAEQLRALGEFAPTSLAAIDKESKITFSDTPPDAPGMVKQLGSDNQLVIDALNAAQHAASEGDQQGLANYLQDRLNTHQKWAWMLRATANENGVKDLARNKGNGRLHELLGVVGGGKTDNG